VSVSATEHFSLSIPAGDLAKLEECLRQQVILDDEFLDEITTHLIEAGGKRLRPSLTLAAASLAGGPREWSAASDATLLGGVSVELVHLASLYHDDVMDEATRRRNVVSVNSRWGNLLAIVAGDFLLARSAEIAANLGVDVARLLASTLGRLCQGQVAEVRATYQLERTEDDYFAAIADKTAALMSTACRIGALTASLPNDQIETLTAYGECLGMVFQIRDDVLDVIADESELGKLPGQDLAEGIYTLPVQHALADKSVGVELRSLLGRPLGRDEVDEARALVAQSNGIAAAGDAARGYAAAAVECARQLGDGPVPDALAQLSMSLVADLDRSAEALAS